jgi:hypothetical protein
MKYVKSENEIKSAIIEIMNQWHRYRNENNQSAAGGTAAKIIMKSIIRK